jgi:hypothetical protein
MVLNFYGNVGTAATTRVVAYYDVDQMYQRKYR